MVNPQAENGHTDIAHEVLEHLYSAGLTAVQWDVLMCILRQSWGWKQKTVEISIRELSKDTGRHRNNISRALSQLSERNLILVEKTKILELETNA